MSHDPLRGAVEIIKDKLYYAAIKTTPATNVRRNGKELHYFSIDNELVYWNFFLDFGPLNLGQLYRFCTKINRKLDEMSNKTIVYYSSIHPSKRANGTFLICAWQMLYLGRSPEDALRGFTAKATTSTTRNVVSQSNKSNPPVSSHTPTTSALPPFHDASPCACTYNLTILDVLHGLKKAREFRFFDFETFDVKEYEHFEQVENGDLNWIVQDRILAFAGPHYKRNVSPEGYCTLTPQEYLPYFLKKRMKLVVRLNKKCYNEEDFTSQGIRFLEQYYLDGSCPPMSILQRILKEFETVSLADGEAFAVHCKAGLGRTGTCIGAYLMKHYRLTAPEVIGWMRICRPGMVIGPQQHFLQDIQQLMWQEGDMMLGPTKALSLSSQKQQGTKQPQSPSSSRTRRIRSSPRHGDLKTSNYNVEVEDSNSPTSVMTYNPGEARPGQSEGLLSRRNAQQQQGRRLF